MTLGETPTELMETVFWKSKLATTTTTKTNKKSNLELKKGESSKAAPVKQNPPQSKGRTTAPPKSKTPASSKGVVGTSRAAPPQPPRGRANPNLKANPAPKALIKTPPGRTGATGKAATAAKVGDKRSIHEMKKQEDTSKSSQSNSENTIKSPKLGTEDTISNILNPISHASRLGLARVLLRLNNNEWNEEVIQLYNNVIEMAPLTHDAYIELGELLVKKDPLQAVDVYLKFPFRSLPAIESTGSYDDAFLYGEAVRLLMKLECFEDPRLQSSMISLGKIMGFPVLEKYINILDSKLKYSKMLRQIYAAVNGKDVDDKDLEAFFKFKLWL